MRIIKHNEEWTLIEVPKGASEYYINEDTELCFYVEPTLSSPDGHLPTGVKIPPGQTYTLIGLAPTLSEEQAGEVVERARDGLNNRNYENPTSMGYISAIASLESLCSHHSIPFENCLIVKTEKKNDSNY